MASLEHRTSLAGHDEATGPHFLTDPAERGKYHEHRKRSLGQAASAAGVIRRPAEAHAARQQAYNLARPEEYHIPVDPEAPKL